MTTLEIMQNVQTKGLLSTAVSVQFFNYGKLTNYRIGKLLVRLLI